MKTKHLTLTALLCILAYTSEAKWAVVCGYFQNQYNCYAVNRSCSGVSGVPLAEWTCNDLAIMVSPPSSTSFNKNKLVRGEAGQASFLINGELIAISSDALEAKMLEFSKLDAKKLMGDDKLQKDFEAFLSKDKGLVSDKRLADISRETGLPIGKQGDKFKPFGEQREQGYPLPGREIGLEGDVESRAVVWTDYNPHDPGLKANPSPKTDANGGFSIKLKEGKYNLIFPALKPAEDLMYLTIAVQNNDTEIFDRWGNRIKEMPKEKITSKTGKISIVVPKGGGILAGRLTTENIK